MRTKCFPSESLPLSLFFIRKEMFPSNEIITSFAYRRAQLNCVNEHQKIPFVDKNDGESNCDSDEFPFLSFNYQNSDEACRHER